MTTMGPGCRFHRDLVAVGPQGRDRVVVANTEPETIWLPGKAAQISPERLLEHQQSDSVALFSDPDCRRALRAWRRHPQISLNDLPHIPTPAPAIRAA